MKVILKRDAEPIEIKLVRVLINDDRYIITESVDGKLNIVKYSDGDSDLIKVHPRTGNEIELS